jgi:hypothetical protein
MQSKHRKKGENKKRKTSLQEGKRKSLLTLTGLLMEGLSKPECPSEPLDSE